MFYDSFCHSCRGLRRGVGGGVAWRDVTWIVARRGPVAPPGETVTSPARTPTGVKVAILAVDGLDWTTVDSAIGAGRLPNLARLIESGTRGNLRSIRPLDQQAIIDTVMKTNRAVIVDESKPFCGVSAQITTLIQEHAFDHLDAPVKRVCSLDAPAIYSAHIEDEQLPNPRRIIEQVLTIA